METLFHANAFVYLTRREQEIMSWLMVGLSSKEIADKLYISKNTVDTHRRNLLKKKRRGSRAAYQHTMI